MDEVDPETQAAMAIQLAENVRKLIREEIKAALESYEFMSTLAKHSMAENIAQAYEFSPTFQRAVKRVIAEQMQKY